MQYQPLDIEYAGKTLHITSQQRAERAAFTVRIRIARKGSMRLAYQGEPGAYSEAAALLYGGEQ